MTISIQCFSEYYPNFWRNIRSEALYPNFLRCIWTTLHLPRRRRRFENKRSLLFQHAISEPLKRSPSSKGTFSVFRNFFVFSIMCWAYFKNKALGVTPTWGVSVVFFLAANVKIRLVFFWSIHLMCEVVSLEVKPVYFKQKKLLLLVNAYVEFDNWLLTLSFNSIGFLHTVVDNHLWKFVFFGE